MKKIFYVIVVLIVLAGCTAKKNPSKLEKSPCACAPIEVPGRV
jgi:uncharacterized protein YcfL